MFRRLVVVGLVLVGAFGSSVQGQTTEDGLRARLVGKPLYLRGMWKSDKLKFDLQGTLLGNSDRVSFTVCGIDITKLVLKSDRLQLEGTRVGVEFRNDRPERVSLSLGGFGSSPEKVRIEVVGVDAGNYKAALDAIFAPSLAEMVPLVPAEWQKFAKAHFLANLEIPSAAGPTPAPPAPGTLKIGGSVSPPRPLKTPEPRFDVYARSLKLSGRCLVYLIVDRTGAPTHIRVVRPIGVGMDEEAMKAVSGYQFVPAMQNGEPVAVEMNVEVEFTVY